MTLTGIDLGNSRTKISTPDSSGNPVILSNEMGELHTPSVVYFDDDRIIVGVEAVNASLMDPSRGVSNWKRTMGRDTILYSAPDGTTYKAKDIARILFGHIADIVEQRTGNLLSEAAVCVPADYNDRQKHETIEAAREAGIEVTLTPHEPTAAAFGNKVHQLGDGLVVVLDLGGGTYDVSLVRVSGNTMDVIATNGDQELGGQDFNKRMTGLLLERFESEHGFRPTQESHPVAYQDLCLRVEQAKIALSARDSTSVMLTCDGHLFSSVITRVEFKETTKDLLDRAMELAEKTLKEAGVDLADVREILRVGGASQMPCFEDSIEERFGRKPSCKAEPFYAVALGTMTMSRLAKERAGEQTVVNMRVIPPLEYRVQDHTAHPFGICTLTEDGKLVNSVLLKKGRPIPSDHTRAFQLANSGQTGALIKVLQGEDGVPMDDCEVLGFFEMKGLKPVFDKPHKIDVRLKIDGNGMLTAEACDPIEGRREEMTITYNKDQVAEEV